jgi:hypothetical protein
MAIATSTALMIAAGASLVGGGVAAYGSYQAGQSQKRAAEVNAKIKENEALREDMESKEATRRMRETNRRKLATQRTRIAGAGVIEEGSPLSLMAETAGMLELEALDARRASMTRQAQLKTAAGMDIFEGNAAARAGSIGAGASLLQGVGQAGSTYAMKG